MQKALLILGIAICIGLICQIYTKIISDKTDSKKLDSSIHIPELKLTLVEYDLDDKPYIALFNPDILKYNVREYYPWYLSIIVEFENYNFNDMPDNDGIIKMQDFFDELNENLIIDKKRPNAIFLGRTTGNRITQIMWYVNNPKAANRYLQKLIKSKKYPLDFQFEMSEDSEWNEAHYWLDQLNNN